MKTLFAHFGLAVMALAILGAFDVGHFRMYYGPDKHGCTKLEETSK